MFKPVGELKVTDIIVELEHVGNEFGNIVKYEVKE